ncbi:TPA: hypothetical protein DIV55_04555 [Patescibacteria group bacterium]|uniref:Prepilin-type N-terminal cleavage/methylation domain-containing protein n=1 Tax=Candidatus Curtissbacteria bacterium GW2011_GWA1_41_11 TaxID=1618409 RepID=A0A0G0WU21_9BACT|nr:MAG: hypothetical protein UU34_C0002G0062 [Candidatus Curtissbacteria bacterium GW2011_GWA1_41_11]HCS78985.1 hypothetical protein [Patescibacteria group bacterium]
MPGASRTINKKQLTRNNVHGGFTLVEILLSLFFIIAIVTILFSTSGSLLTRRRSDQQSIAAKVATKDIEYLRGLAFASLPATSPPGPSGCLQLGGSTDPDLTKLRDGKCARTITNYEGNAIIKQTTVTVYWDNDNGVEQQLKMDTLIYESGL